MTPRSISLLVVLGAVALTISTASAEPHVGEVDLRARAQVMGARIRLEDLGRLSGEALEWADLDLGHAPEAGATRRITGAAILAQLRDEGLDEDRIRYSIPTSVRVRRAHQEVDPEEIRQAIHRRVREFLPEGDELDAVELPPRLRVPLGDFAIRVSAPEPKGRHEHHTEVEIEQAGRVVARGQARVRISSRGPVVIARKPVARGAPITGDDVRVEQRAMRGMPSSLLTDPGEAIGRFARVSIAAGTILTGRHIDAPLLVERGDLVRVAIETDGMRLTVPAEALDSASLGERVRLKNRSSGRELTAEVIAHGKARVHY